MGSPQVQKVLSPRIKITEKQQKFLVTHANHYYIKGGRLVFCYMTVVEALPRRLKVV